MYSACQMRLDADLLEQLQAKENDGRGITCVRSIVSYLRQGDWESAKAIRRNEGDKTRSYPEVEKALGEIFGCRLHGMYACKDEWCQ